MQVTFLWYKFIFLASFNNNSYSKKCACEIKTDRWTNYYICSSLIWLTLCMIAVPYQQNMNGWHIILRKPNRNFKMFWSWPHVCKRENTTSFMWKYVWTVPSVFTATHDTLSVRTLSKSGLSRGSSVSVVMDCRMHCWDSVPIKQKILSCHLL